MRIDILELAKRISKADLQRKLEILNDKYKLDLTLNLWDSFINEMTPVNNRQIAMFGQIEGRKEGTGLTVPLRYDK